MLKHKKLYAVLGALVILLGTVGFAYAQGPQPPKDGQPFFGRGAFGGGGMRGRMPFGRGPFQGRGGYSLVEAAAEVTGLSEEEIIAALEEGQTFAEIAEGEGADPQEIVDAVLEEREAALQEAVDAGRLTEDQMTQMLEDMAEHITDQLDGTHEPRPFGDRGLGGVLGQFGGSWTTMFDAVADALGLTPEGLFTELHDGQTVAEIAEDQGVEMEAIRDALEDSQVEVKKQAIEQAVEDGRLSQEQADWMIEGLEKGYAPRGRGFRFAPGRGQHGRGRGW